MSIREASSADISTIQALAEAIWQPTYTPILGSVQVHYMLDKFYSADALEDQIKSGQGFLLLEDDAHTVGFASFSKMDARTFKLNKLYVLSNLQSKGLGKALLKEVIARVKAAGGQTLILNVNRHNKAKGFYERFGFEVTSEENIDIGSGYFMNDFVMQLLL